MAGIHALAQKYRFKIIEDASHAIGARYKGQSIGNCRYSDVTVFSFHPFKIITTGEGGVALTNQVSLANRMVRLRSHGITRDAAEMTQAPDGPWYYQQLELGYNFRMTEIQAALGCSQLKRLEQFVARRHLLAANYAELLKNEAVRIPWQHPDAYSSFHLYIVRLRLSEIKVSHREVFERLRVGGISVNLHYIPIYRHPFFAESGAKPQDFPESEQYYSEAISLPLYPDLTEEQQATVARRLLTPIGHQTIF
jgi:dTDP-4-amino-4,6-dideoxygalactose transaminase